MGYPPPAVFAPPPPLSAKETAAVAAVRAALGQHAGATPEATRWCTDACVCRYLRARQWDVAKAAALLQATLEWRAAEAIDSLSVDAVAEEAETGKMQRLSCLDLHGRPVLLLRPGFENTTGMAGQMKFLAYTLEDMVRAMAGSRDGHARGAAADLAPEQWTVLVDFTGFSLSNSPPMKTTMETLRILQNHFPERMGQAILFAPPRLFRATWAIIKPFVDVKTVAKIHFVDASTPHGQTELLSLFNIAQLDKSLGGKADLPWNFKEWKLDMAAEDAQAAARAAEGE